MGRMQRLQPAAAIHINAAEADECAYLDIRPPIHQLIYGNVESVMLQSVAKAKLPRAAKSHRQRTGTCAQGA